MPQPEPVIPIPSKRTELIVAPKDYFLGPIFAASKQTRQREVTVGDRRYLIGGFHPMRRNYSPPALDVRHARAIFCLLSFRDPFSPTRLIRFSFNEFCRRYARSNGGRYARAIAEIVADLLDAYIRVTDLKTNVTHEYRLIERIDVEKRPIRRKDARLASVPQLEMWFNGCTLSPEFSGLLNRIAELQQLDLDVFTAIRSPLAQAIYLYIPSRAVHHAENDPFEITVSRLLDQISFPLPAFKSRRQELLTKHQEEGRSILQQLDGLAILSGRFRVALAQTADGSDWKLQAWVEKAAPSLKPRGGDSKLLQAYLKAGHTQEELDRVLKRVGPLDPYELELMETAHVTAEGSTRFFELAKAIVGATQFVSLLAEAKGDMLEGRPARKSPTARLIFRIMQAVRRSK